VATTYLMRGWDPAGEEYKHWTAPEYDSAGIFYVGPPAFGTLVGVTAIDIFLELEVVGFVAWDPVFDTTQEVAQLTEDAVQFSDESELRDVPTLEATGQVHMDNPGQPTMEHASVSYESELRDVPTLVQSGLGISPAPLHQFEAI